MSSGDRLDALERLHRLREAGALSHEEFAAEKARILGRAGGEPPALDPVAPAAPLSAERSKLPLWIGGSAAALVVLVGGARLLFPGPLVPVANPSPHRSAAAPRARPSPLADPTPIPAASVSDTAIAAPAALAAADAPTPRRTEAVAADRADDGHRVPSLDGGYVYRMVDRYATSDEVVQVRVADGRTRDVIDGNAVRVIRNGPYRGYLLVERRKYRAEGGAYDPTDLVRPDGKVMATLPLCEDDESESCVSDWLSARGWRAS